MAFAPGLGVHGLMLVEDQWPSAGDNDFDDVALHYNFMFRMNAAGQVVGLRLTLNAQALGGTYDNGLGLRLAGVPSNMVASAVRIVGGGAAQPLTLSAQDADATLILSSNLRDLFAGQAGRINSVAQSQVLTAQTLEVDIAFTGPVSLSVGASPFDLFVMRTSNPAHQIHRPEFSGTASMDVALFNTANDASAPPRHFVDASGLPFVLLIPEGSAYPLEGQPISSLFPNILGFASSGGATNADFYLTPQAAFAFANPPAPTLPRGTQYSVDTSCMATCTPGTPGCQTTACVGGSGGVQVIDPNGGSASDAFSAYCEAGSEGWTKLESAAWPFLFGSGNWQDYNGSAPASDNYSMVGRLPQFADTQGCFTFKLEVGNTGTWDGSPAAHTTVWTQCHNPFTETTNGSDYTFISGEESTTCGGFNGLHHKYQGFSYTSDPDSGDGVGCWWMQIVPNRNYNSAGYLEGYGGVSNYHNWQVLWVKADVAPVIDSLSVSNSNPDPGVQSTLTARAHDPSGQAVTASWTVSDTRWQLSSSGLGATVTAPSVAVPPVDVTLTVTNAGGASTTQTVTINPTLGCTGGTSACPARYCASISGAPGMYWIDPNGGAPVDAYQAYCQPGGDGWVKVMSAAWPFLYNTSNWQDYNGTSAGSANYSSLNRRQDFIDNQGCYTYMLEVGNSGSWNTSTPAHYTVWTQCHDPFTQTTNGSDYTFIAGQASTTCGGFNGLHNKYQGFSFTSDPDSTDSVGCWWMQVVPNRNYNSAGYLEGYGGASNYHNWQTLWMRSAP